MSELMIHLIIKSIDYILFLIFNNFNNEFKVSYLKWLCRNNIINNDK